VSSYSRWNWRILGSLMLDVTFHGNFNIPGANVTEEETEIGQDDSSFGSKDVEFAANSTNQSGFDVCRKTIRTRMRAKVDSKPINAWEGADEDDTAEGVAASRMDGWNKEAWVFVERELDCAISRARKGKENKIKCQLFSPI
jgi:hypothetical protein